MKQNRNQNDFTPHYNSTLPASQHCRFFENVTWAALSSYSNRLFCTTTPSKTKEGSVICEQERRIGTFYNARIRTGEHVDCETPPSDVTENRPLRERLGIFCGISMEDGLGDEVDELDVGWELLLVGSGWNIIPILEY